MADKNRVATYIFEPLTNETLNSPFGKVETIRMERTNTNPKHAKVIFWVAPTHDYIPVRIIGIEKGQIVAEANLQTYERI